MIEHLDNACLSNTTGFKILHSIFSGQVDCFDLSHWIRYVVGLLSNLCLSSLLKDINLVSHEDFDWDLTGPLALSDPLLDPLECGFLCHIKQVDDSC